MVQSSWVETPASCSDLAVGPAAWALCARAFLWRVMRREKHGSAALWHAMQMCRRQTCQ